VLLAVVLALLTSVDARAQGRSPALDTTEATSTVGDTTVVTSLPADRQPRLIGGLNALRKAVRYPRKARKQGIEGRVIVRFIVDTDGRVQEASVPEPVHPLLDEAAIKAVRTMKFVPGQKDGERVAVQLSVPIGFWRYD